MSMRPALLSIYASLSATVFLGPSRAASEAWVPGRSRWLLLGPCSDPCGRFPVESWSRCRFGSIDCKSIQSPSLYNCRGYDWCVLPRVQDLRWREVFSLRYLDGQECTSVAHEDFTDLFDFQVALECSDIIDDESDLAEGAVGSLP
jgi:hypothetical protein